MEDENAHEMASVDGIPLYLIEHYAHAYLSPLGTRVFDIQVVINAILFGQYRKLMRAMLGFLGPGSEEPVLQLSCVYGELTQILVRQNSPGGLHITDVTPVQLELARRKSSPGGRLLATRMRAEQLGYADDAFATAILFFLLHEMPAVARWRTLMEAVRVLRPGGRLLITDYAPMPWRHPLYRCLPLRRVLEHMEPYLAGFWREDLDTRVAEAAARHRKCIAGIRERRVFRGFYRVVEYRLTD